MWLGFPIGGISMLAATFAFGYSKYRKDKSLTKFTLVSRFPNDVRINFTIDREGRDIPRMLEYLRSFSGICEISEQNRHNIELCCCELCDSVRERRLPMIADCFDLAFRQDNNRFIMSVKVPGAPYCLKVGEEELKKYHSDPGNLSTRELKEIILNEMPDSISYRYIFSLNVTTLSWKI